MAPAEGSVRRAERRFALVTGTSSGIGESVARLLLERGWHVLGISRRPAPIEHGEYEHLAIDLGDARALVGEAEARLDRVLGDATWARVALVNNAADIGLLGQMDRLDLTTIPAVFAVNFSAAMWLIGQLVRRARPGVPLRIVNVSTAAAVHGFAGLGAYGASKAALRLGGMVLGAELDQKGDERLDITILSYEPGTVDTPMQAAARGSSAETLPSVGMFKSFVAKGSLVPPEAPARDIVAYVEGDGHARFEERRHGR